MKINKLHIKNFRGYTDLKVDLQPHFNLIIGDNGSGKTALLQALTVAMSSYFLGIRNVYARGIYKNDVRIATYEYSEEYQFPVEVSACGNINGVDLCWSRALNGLGNSRTTTKDAKEVQDYASDLQHIITSGENVNLPLLAYYATGRLFDEARDVESKKVDEPKVHIASRFRAYDKCLESKSTYKQFHKWFKAKELSRIQKRTEDIALNLVQEAVINNIPNCRNFYFEFDPDKPQGLKVELTDGRILPFTYLSDGTRNFFALISDIAYKAVTLNPHLRERALLETEGIVLIDELDLHLHPEWQRRIVEALKKTFPKIQFICTTHSPFIIQATEENELLIIRDNQIRENNSGVNMSIEDIAEMHQKVENPQWSTKRQELYKIAPKYFEAALNDNITDELQKQFDNVFDVFANDSAYMAIIDKKKVIQEYLKNKNESSK
ncbi:AAA family ATPase [Myroides sp. C15-4]|uniref:AAA family ATPase n=1 Tax=Myroides sp. C15-4 TaxID=3400532 RepID=UPI003D2F7865